MERPIFNQQFRQRLASDGFNSTDLESVLDGGKRSAKVVRVWTGYSNEDISNSFFNPEEEDARKLIFDTFEEGLGPWKFTRTTQDLPIYQAKELSRATGLSVQKVLDVLNRFPFTISISSQKFTSVVSKPEFTNPPGLKDGKSFNVSPIKVERDSRFLSRPPGGGSVQKARVVKSRIGSIIKKKAWENCRIGFAPIIENNDKSSSKDVDNSYDIYSLLTKLFGESIYKPALPEEITRRVLESRTSGEPLTLFVPWGTRLEGQIGPEPQVLDKILNVQRRMQQRGINAQVLLLPADSYATEINQVDPKWTADYFSEIRMMAEARGFDMILWSQMKADNQSDYDAIAEGLDEETIQQIISPYTIKGALLAAGRRSGYNSPEDIRNAAFAYLRERICEGLIVDRLYQPIKLSGVSKKKDNDIDGPLPRLYLIPPELQFSWLK